MGPWRETGNERTSFSGRERASRLVARRPVETGRAPGAKPTSQLAASKAFMSRGAPPRTGEYVDRPARGPRGVSREPKSGASWHASCIISARARPRARAVPPAC